MGRRQSDRRSGGPGADEPTPGDEPGQMRRRTPRGAECPGGGSTAGAVADVRRVRRVAGDSPLPAGCRRTRQGPSARRGGWASPGEEANARCRQAGCRSGGVRGAFLCAPHHAKIHGGANRTTDWRQSAPHLAAGVKHEQSGWPKVQGGEFVVTVHVFYRYRAVLAAVREIF